MAVMKYGAFRSSGEVVSCEEINREKFTACMDELRLLMMKAGKENDPSAAVNVFLEQLAGVFHAHYLLMFEKNPVNRFDCTFCVKDGKNTIDKAGLQNMPGSYFLEFLDAFRDYKGYIIADLEAYKAENEHVYAFLKENEIHEIVSFPIIQKGELIGFTCLGNFDEEYLDITAMLLGLASNFLSQELRLRTSQGFIAEQAKRDGLTGLYSADAFEHSLGLFISALHAGVRTGKWDLVCLNIHKFKAFNNEHGFEAGDELLQNFGEILKNAFQTDIITRMMADNFYAVIEDEKAENAVKGIEAEVKERTHNTVSIYTGIYTLTGQEEESGLAMDRAKIAADEAGKNYARSLCRFNSSLEDKLRMDAYLIAHLDEAIENHWIKVYYQPVVGTLSGKISSVEALARWDDPDYGFLTPDKFIPVLENARLLYKLDLYVLEVVCQINAESIRRKQRYGHSSVNLSRGDLHLPDLHERINALMAKYKVPHDSVHFEITETVLSEDEDAIREHIRRFHEDGYEVWLDDFGSGYSSLNTLHNFDLDCVKIDMKFMRTQNERTPILMRSIIDMAKHLGMLTLTEGVETREQYNFLKSIGCSFVQGYLYSKPDTLENLMKREDLRAIGEESPKEIIFYRQIARVNVLNSYNPIGGDVEEIPRAILRFDEDQEVFLYTNEQFRRFSAKILGHAWTECDNTLHDQGVLYPHFKAMADEISRSKKSAAYDFAANGMTGKLSFEFIADYLGQRAFYVRIMNLEEYHASAESKFRMIQSVLSLFKTVGIASPEENRFQVLYGTNIGAGRMESLALSSALDHFMDKYIPEDEHERCREFMDIRTIKDRLDKTPQGVINSFFHLQQQDGTYDWTRFVISRLKVNQEVEHYLVGFGRNIVGWDQARVRNLMDSGNVPADIASVYEGDNSMQEEALWHSLMRQDRLGMFWKDRNRRFVGANHAFLKYYDLDLQDLLGKNDEDMKWHPDPEPFRQDELAVLNEGKVINEAVGECIVQGEVRKIMASKVPVYKNGQIIGLVGYFVDITNVASIASIYNAKENTDRLTGLLNKNGFWEVSRKASEAYSRGGSDFGMLEYQVVGTRRFRDSYGSEKYAALLRAFSEKIKEAVPENSYVSHGFGGRFNVMVPCHDMSELMQYKAEADAALSGIHVIGRDTPVTVFFVSGAALYSDYLDLSEMRTAALRSMVEAETLDGNILSATGRKSYNQQEIRSYIHTLRKCFDIVRLVDPIHLHCLHFDNNKLIMSDDTCFSVWNKEQRCSNCISAKAISENRRFTKIEERNGDIFFVMANPVEVNGRICSLECVAEMTNIVLNTEDSLISKKQLDVLKDKVYKDALTGTFNRRYYEEVAKGMFCSAAAFIDVNDFKIFNDGFGHEAGDETLRKVAEVLLRNVRKTDAVIRYGGDEFFLFFRDLSNKEVFAEKLNTIQKEINEIRITSAPGVNVSVSIGAIMDFNTVAKLVHRTDKLMYEAKKQKNHLTILEPEKKKV